MTRVGSDNSNWRGGRRRGGDGGKYILIYAPGHPAARAGAVLEHRLVMEQHLGRYLTDAEVVHHLNGDPTDNRLSNLEVMTQAEHARLHYDEALRPHAYIRPPAIREVRTCECCGGSYEAVGAKERTRRFCSRSCYWSYRRTSGGALQKGSPA